MEYTCEKFKKNNNKDDTDNSNYIDEDINKIINKNKKEKNVNKKNGNINAKKKGRIMNIIMKKILNHKKRISLIF